MKRQPPVELPEGYVEFYVNLENMQNEQQILLAKSSQFETFDIKRLFASGNKPIIEQKGIAIDADDYKSVLINVINFMKQNRPDAKVSMEKLELEIDSLDLEQIISKLITFDTDDFFKKLAEDMSLTQELLIFVFDHAIRPFLRIYSAPYLETLLKDDSPLWPFPNICPVCGSKSNFSHIRSADNRRFMFCDRCFSEWETRFLQCVHCGNDEPTTIKYLSVENDDAYQLYLCDKCQGYLKTYDERQKEEITDLFIADIETIYLDMLAQEKGYTNHND
ncbi:MAG TPA: formate dehydrogenase accessory protein FdhE [Syntrophomonadaceae bacterium]|nr:formate dehydrogenase accessory protein FdhE [Syntrophomonadaceae bacterium]